MKVKCVIELEHTGDFDVEALAENLQLLIETDEQTFLDKGIIRVITPYSSTYLGVRD